MYSFRSWIVFLITTKNLISKPYILYTAIHRISFNEEAKARDMFSIGYLLHKDFTQNSLHLNTVTKN